MGIISEEYKNRLRVLGGILKEEKQIIIPDLAHLIRHSTEDNKESGSKMSPETLQKALKELRTKIVNGQYDFSPYVDNGGYIRMMPGGVVGYNAVLTDDDGSARRVWDAEFNTTLDMQEGETRRAKTDPKYIWQKRKGAEIAVLVNMEKKSEPTKEITAIVGPEEDGKVPVYTVFPGSPAPKCDKSEEEFWKTHYFTGKGLDI